MQHFLLHLLPACLLTLASCASTQHLYPGEERPDDKVALVSTKLSQASGGDDILVELKKVDGQNIDADEHDAVALLAGQHVFQFGFTKTVDSGGFPLALSFNFFGNDNTLYEPPADRVIESTSNVTLFYTVQEGKRYKITSTDNLTIEAASNQGVPDGWGSLFPQDTIRGSWEPGLTLDS